MPEGRRFTKELRKDIFAKRCAFISRKGTAAGNMKLRKLVLRPFYAATAECQHCSWADKQGKLLAFMFIPL